MKILYIVRHAKSSWKERGLSDFERPLNKRGKRDAPFMAELIANKNEIPELIVSSPAKRALTTAKTFAKQFKIIENSVITNESIYEAGIGNLMSVVNSLPENNESVMLFGHNPGLTMLSNYLSDKYIDNIPTCAIVKICFDVETWDNISDRSGKILLFEYPKKYFD